MPGRWLPPLWFPVFCFFPQRPEELLDGRRRELLSSPPARRHLAVRDFPVADHDRVRNFVQLGSADLVPEFLVAEIPFGPVPRGAEGGDHLPTVFGMTVRDGENVDLDGRKPEGEGARLTLDENAEEPLQRPQERPVDHDGAVLRPVVTDERHVETVRVVEIDLDRRTLPGTAQNILDLDVDFRAVENALPGVYLVGQTFAVKRPLERLLGFGPVLGRPGVFFRPGGEEDLVPVEPEP